VFVALYPAPDDAARLLSVIGGRSLPPHRTTTPEQVHLTLAFLGPTRVREIDDVIESVERAAKGVEALTLEVRALVTMPRVVAGEPEIAPRSLAVETSAPSGLVELHKRLWSRVLAPRGHRLTGFVPHVTLCRFEHGVVAPINEPLEPWPIVLSDLGVVESVVRAGGAVHKRLGTVALGAE
jgi:2'-5' RNA ligase